MGSTCSLSLPHTNLVLGVTRVAIRRVSCALGLVAQRTLRPIELEEDVVVRFLEEDCSDAAVVRVGFALDKDDPPPPVIVLVVVGGVLLLFVASIITTTLSLINRLIFLANSFPEAVRFSSPPNLPAAVPAVSPGTTMKTGKAMGWRFIKK